MAGKETYQHLQLQQLIFAYVQVRAREQGIDLTGFTWHWCWLNRLHKEALSNLGFGQQNSMQSVMINEFLQSEISGSGQILASLDPSREPSA